MLNLVQVLREASGFYAKERPRGTPPSLTSNEIGPGECEAIAKRFDDAASRIEHLTDALQLTIDYIGDGSPDDTYAYVMAQARAAIKGLALAKPASVSTEKS